jgi:hypothetical protein
LSALAASGTDLIWLLGLMGFCPKIAEPEFPSFSTQSAHYSVQQRILLMNVTHQLLPKRLNAIRDLAPPLRLRRSTAGYAAAMADGHLLQLSPRA